jgi:hypothetical protein
LSGLLAAARLYENTQFQNANGTVRVNRREFCLSLVALPALISPAGMATFADVPPRITPAKPDRAGRIHFVLQDPLEHPFYWWPRTLLSYPVEFDPPVELRRMALTRVDTGERIPVQFSEVIGDRVGVRRATLNFVSDLPSGARREFVLAATAAPVTSQP